MSGADREVGLEFTRRLALAAAIAFIGGGAAAEPWRLAEVVGAPEALTLSGSVRLRYEALSGQPRAGLDPQDDLVSVRTTLFAEYDFGALRVGGELFDSRAYDGEAGSAIGTGEVNTLELVQAYVALDAKEPFGPKTQATVQAGRFTLNLGSRRLVAADDYRNTTNGYTGLRVDARLPQGWGATGIYTLPQVRLPDDLPAILDNETAFDEESFDLVLWGGYLWRTVAPGLMVEGGFFALEEDDAPGRPTRNRDLKTGSLRVIRDPKPGRLDFEVEAIRQWGDVRASLAATAPRLEVSAGFLHLEAGYQFRDPAKTRLALEYDYASGDDSEAKFGRFDTLFGMRRADLAPAGIYAAIGRTNLEALRLEATPSPKLDYFLTWRALRAASATDSFSTTGVRDPSGRSGRFAGHQLDGRVRYWLAKDQVRLELNGALLFKGRLLERAPNAPRTGDTRYLSLALVTSF
jgi:hypothetical protein